MLISTHKDRKGHAFRYWLAASAVSLFILNGCGGGSGSDSNGGAQSVTYTGNTNAAEIDSNNSMAIVSETFTGSDVASASNQTLVESAPAKSTSSKFVAQKLLQHAKILSEGGKHRAPGVTTLQALTVDINAACPKGGSIRLVGELDDTTHIGSLNYSYHDCSDGHVRLNGSAVLNINAYNAELDTNTDFELIYNNLHFVGVNPADAIDWQVGASLHLQEFYTAKLDPFTARSTINMTLVDNISSASFKVEDYITEVVFDRYQGPSSATLDVDGRIYHYLHGYVDINTVTPLIYSTIEPWTYPDAGGPIIYTGALNKKIRLTPIDAVLVNVAADADGDDRYEFSVTVPWERLDDEWTNDYAPVANAGSDVTISLGQTATLDAGLSTDADYNLLVYSWSVIDQPAGSDAGLIDAGTINPSVTPNMAGSYTLQVRVSDGRFSDTDVVIVTVTP